MGTPLVSVVMSVYNGARFLSNSLQSVLAQEGVDFEVVIVDDGSTDGSSDLLAEYGRRDRRLRVLRQENAGLTRALVRACGEARGTLIARQDADDLAMPGRLRALAEVLQNREDVAIAACWVDLVGPGDEFLLRTTFPEGVPAGTKVVLEEKRNPVHGSTMFRKADFDAVGGYRAQFYVAQDADLWLRLVDRGGILFVPEVLYRFRVVDGSITTSHREAQERLHALAWNCRKAREAGEPEERWLREAAGVRPGAGGARRLARGAGSYFIGRTLLGNGDPRAALYLKAFVRECPFHPKGWLSLLQALSLPRSPGAGPMERMPGR